MAKDEVRRSRKIPTVSEFQKLSDDRQLLAYEAAYGSLKRGEVPLCFQEKRKRLLKAYRKAAGWNEETVSRIEAAADTAIH